MKRKGSLETRAEPSVFPLLLEFRKLLGPSLREHAWKINKKVRGTIQQLKVKGLSSCLVLNLKMSGKDCLFVNWHSSRAAHEIPFLEYQQRMTNTVQTGETILLQLLLMIRWWRQFKKTNSKPNILRRIILKNTWSVISKLFLLNCSFHYISNWSKVLEFYLTSFFNMNSWRVKFRNFLGDLPVHYAGLFINRTINNNYMTFSMALHHAHDGFWYFF